MTGSDPWAHLITGVEVFDLHRIGLDLFGGVKPGVKPESLDCVEGKLGSAWYSELFRAEEIGTLPGLCFAGHLLYYLARTQCFSDGNKRAAWASAMAVLAELGLTIEVSQEEVVQYVNEIAVGTTVKSGSDVVLWMASRLSAPEDTTYEQGTKSATVRPS